jgi:hypothetical protein
MPLHIEGEHPLERVEANVAAIEATLSTTEIVERIE